MEKQHDVPKQLECFYSKKMSSISDLEAELKSFHELKGVKGNGEEYAFYSNGTQYRLAVNTWDGEGKWEKIVSL